jgi:N-acetylglucosamine-6-phosphate deacetylase
MISQATIHLINGTFVLPDRVLPNGQMVVSGRQILSIGNASSPDGFDYTVDLEGRVVTPGLIDIHIHGALGSSFDEGTENAFSRILEANASMGVTSLLATTVTAPIEEIARVLSCARDYMGATAGEEPIRRAELLGVHVEGPYFSAAQAGAQDPAYLRAPADGSPAKLLEYSDVMRIMSFAPELPGAADLAKQLKERGVLVAAGHSAAREEEVGPCLDQGLSHFIHLWSGQSTTVREGAWRKPGLLEVALTYPGVTGEIIADNRHLPPTLMKLAYQCLGAKRLCAVSDATSGAGLAEGSRFRMGHMEYVVGNGVGMLLDGSAFAGSTTLLSQMLPILVEVVGVPLVDAVQMVSSTPARIIGVDGSKGKLAAGMEADLVVFGYDWRPWKVMKAGKWL